MTRCHRLKGLQLAAVYLPEFWRRDSKGQVRAGWVPPEALLLSKPVAAFSPCPSRGLMPAHPWCRPLLTSAPILKGEGPPPAMTSFNSDYLLKDPVSNAVLLRIRASTYEAGDTAQSVMMVKTGIHEAVLCSAWDSL